MATPPNPSFERTAEGGRSIPNVRRPEMNNTALYEFLKECRYDPEAASTYDIMAGGLVWSDEAPSPESGGSALRAAVYLRKVIAYRASLSLGEPRTELEEDWNELKKHVPDWPGFKDERIYGRAQRLLKIHKYKEAKLLNGNGLDKVLGDL